MSDAITSGLFTIVGATIGVVGTVISAKFGKPSKKVSVVEFGIQNLSANLSKLGFDVQISRNGEKFGNVFQQRLQLRNIGRSSIEKIEVHFFDSANRAKVVGVNIGTESVVSRTSVSSHTVSEHHTKCLIGYMNPKSTIDLFVLYDELPFGPKFEIKTADFLVYNPKDIYWLEVRKRLLFICGSGLAGWSLSWVATHNLSEMVHSWLQ